MLSNTQKLPGIYPSGTTWVFRAPRTRPFCSCHRVGNAWTWALGKDEPPLPITSNGSRRLNDDSPRSQPELAIRHFG